jgi:uncharacterized protein YdcH (DUF465 family)
MKKVEVKKLWNGRVSLRDYIVDDALSKQQGIRVKYKDEMYQEYQERKGK